MAKPSRTKDNRLNTSEGPRKGGDCAGAAEAEAEGRGGKQGDETAEPPPPSCRRRESTQERHEATESGAETEGDKYEGHKMDMDTYGETPRGATVEVIGRRGDNTPWRKTKIFQTLPLNMRTCCCRESMETSRTTMMGRTWEGESRTTLYGSVVGAGLLHSQQSGTPLPLDQ